MVCSGFSDRQVAAIADFVSEEARKLGSKVYAEEGMKDGRWALIDLGAVIVHVFQEKSREFYDLDRLWREAKVVSVPVNLKQLPDLPFSMNTAGMQIPKLAPFSAATMEPAAEDEYDELDEDDLNDE